MNKNYMVLNNKFKYKISINYPNTNIFKINKIIKDKINNIKDEFIKNSKRNIQLNMFYTLYITYDEFKYKGITSIIFNISTFTGGAHPNNYLLTLNYNDLGNIIILEDLIKKDNNILNKLSNISRKKLLAKDEFKDDNTIKKVLDGTRPNKDNFKNLAFTKKEL